MSSLIPRRNVGSGVRLIALLAAGALSWAGPTAWARPPSRPGSHLQYSPTLGQERVLRVRMTGEVTFDLDALGATLGTTGGGSGSKGRQTQRYELAGDLHGRVVALQGSLRRVSMRLRDARFTVDGRAEGRVALLETPFLATYSARGSLQKLELPVGLPREIGQRLRGLLEALDLDLGEAGAREWTATEADGQGRAQVRYRLLGVDETTGAARLSRQVISADRILSGGRLRGSVAPSRTDIEAPRGDILWAADGAGLVALHTRDTIRDHAGANEVMAGTSEVHAEVVPGSARDLPSTEQEARAQLEQGEAGRADLYEVPLYWEPILAGLDAPAVLDRFFASVQDEPHEAVPLLKNYLRMHPEDVREIAVALDAQIAGPGGLKAAGFGWSAIALAAHPQAQAVIGEAIAGGTFKSSYTQQKALESILSLIRPEPFLLPLVWDLRESLPKKGKHAQYRLSVVTNLYGMLGGVEHGVAQNTRSVVETLGARLRSARDRFETHRMLIALGNVGDLDRTLPLVEPFFASEDDALAGAAFQSFRKAEGEEAFGEFARRYAAETRPGVRDEASRVVVNMPDTAARVAWARAEVEHERAPAILERLARIFGETMATRPESEPALRRMLEVIDERTVRKTVYRYISPSPVGGAR